MKQPFNQNILPSITRLQGKKGINLAPSQFKIPKKNRGQSRPTESEQDQRDVELAAVVSDAVDGATRLLADVAKLGLGVRELHILKEPRGDASVRMALTLPSEFDAANICSRLRRHVTVVSLELA